MYQLSYDPTESKKSDVVIYQSCLHPPQYKASGCTHHMMGLYMFIHANVFRLYRY